MENSHEKGGEVINIQKVEDSHERKHECCRHFTAKNLSWQQNPSLASEAKFKTEVHIRARDLNFRCLATWIPVGHYRQGRRQRSISKNLNRVVLRGKRTRKETKMEEIWIDDGILEYLMGFQSFPRRDQPKKGRVWKHPQQ